MTMFVVVEVVVMMVLLCGGLYVDNFYVSKMEQNPMYTCQ